jgi:para-aminobenzoate synthetase / 4-amino-4-deoxychorismate lyase
MTQEHKYSTGRVPYDALEERLKQVAGTPNSVLLETSHLDAENQRSFLFLHPIRILSASKLDGIPCLFRELEEALDSGLHVAGFVGYECGYHFQSLEGVSSIPSEMPLAWFGVYSNPLVYEHSAHGVKGGCLPSAIDERADVLENFQDDTFLTISEDEYCAKVEQIKDYILAGDTYQVNFTDSVNGPMSWSAADVFATLSRRQPVAYSAFLNLNSHQILSFSPELFFKVEEGRIVTRPMKGTMPRGRDSVEDIKVAASLRSDEKNRAEHVMIVDLLRNDLGRICNMGSVQVEDIFSVEKYRTLFQMTSTISGTLRPEVGYYDIFKSMFPSGSVTGAPKIRTMQIIQELEQKPREVYCGAIGFISPDRSSMFNVAIRTIVLKDGQARMGIGGAIVADSRPLDEYRECQLKASFLTRPRPSFQLVETMLWNNGFAFFSMHLDRVESSASYFDFSFDRTSIASQLLNWSNQFASGKHYRVRLLMDCAGNATITATTYLPDRSICSVRVSAERTSSDDVFLRHKTTFRNRYERLYAEARADGFDEVLFLNEREEVTEGAINNVFVVRDGGLITPPLNSGVLPGVFRRHLLETDATAEERVLHLQDLQSSDGVFLCNSVRGMRQVNSLRLDPFRREVTL